MNWHQVQNLTDSHQASSTSYTSQGSRAYAAKDARFETALREFNVSFEESEEPIEDDVVRIAKILERDRDSPEPCAKTFHDIRNLVISRNEAAVTNRMTPLLMPHRDMPKNNAKTKNLLFQQDMSWTNWGSVQSGILPKPKPDFCVLYKSTFFTSAQQELLGSPHLNSAGTYPFLVLEVKTALQGSHIADIQNANNMVPILIRDYLLHQSFGQSEGLERKIRFLALAYDTKNMWIRGWFYVRHDNGRISWHSKLMKQVPFAIRAEKGYEIARRYILTWMEYMSNDGFK